MLISSVLLCDRLMAPVCASCQVNGVKFMFNCLMGLGPNPENRGCILGEHFSAVPVFRCHPCLISHVYLCVCMNVFVCILCLSGDEMGLGKTIQSVTLLYTLLTQGEQCVPLCCVQLCVSL